MTEAKKVEQVASDKIKVLLVEDDAMIVDIYKLRLESEGYEVTVTEKGSEALELAKSQKPAIILLDIMLPETDGFSILKTLKDDVDLKSIPVILLTNLSQESDHKKGLEYGAQEYLVKSQNTPAEVIQKVQKLINNEIV